MNNFEKIKNMNIDDLAIFLSTFAYTCGETEYNQEDYLQWLQQESEGSDERNDKKYNN